MPASPSPEKCPRIDPATPCDGLGAVIEAVRACCGYTTDDVAALAAGSQAPRTSRFRGEIVYVLRHAADPPPTLREIAAAFGDRSVSTIAAVLRDADARAIRAAGRGARYAWMELADRILLMGPLAAAPPRGPALSIGPRPAPRGEQDPRRLAAALAERFHAWGSETDDPVRFEDLEEEERDMWIHLAHVARRVVAEEHAGVSNADKE